MLTEYDLRAIEELVAWKDPELTRRGRVADRAERAIDRVARLVPTRLVEKVLAWLLPRLRRLTWRATSWSLVQRAYAREGAAVERLPDVASLPLEIADRAAGDKRIHEGAVAGVEGAAAGFFGGLALAGDVAAVILLSIRAVQSRALAYGFDPADDAELAFTLQVLDEATRLGPGGSRSARQGLSLVGRRMGERALTQEAVKRVMQRLPEQLVVRLAAMKSESVAPVLGAATSFGFNAWYLQRVTHTARMAYRERFLRRAHGDDLLTAYGL